MSKIKNEKTDVPSGIKMNDEDFLKDMLDTEKGLLTLMGTLATEASHEGLSNKVDTIIKEIKQSQRNVFELAFANGWYVLEEASKTNIDEKLNEFQTKLDDLEQQN